MFFSPILFSFLLSFPNCFSYSDFLTLKTELVLVGTVSYNLSYLLSELRACLSFYITTHTPFFPCALTSYLSSSSFGCLSFWALMSHEILLPVFGLLAGLWFAFIYMETWESLSLHSVCLFKIIKYPELNIQIPVKS